MSKLLVTTNFVQSLLAVLLGNAAYYILMPSLPPAARHRLLQVDLGLVGRLLVLRRGLRIDSHGAVVAASKS